MNEEVTFKVIHNESMREIFALIVVRLLAITYYLGSLKYAEIDYQNIDH